MKSIEQIYDTIIYPERKQYNTKQYEKELFIFLNTEHELKRTLPEKDICRLKKLCNSAENREYEYGKEMFKAGFTYGMKLASEIFNKED